MNEIAEANEITGVNDLPRVNKITKDTKVSAILEEYGDIADVMEAFGGQTCESLLLEAHDHKSLDR